MRPALQRSGRLVRERWGESVAGTTNLGLVFGVVMFVVVMVVGIPAFSSEHPSDGAIAIPVAAFVLTTAAFVAANELLRLALFRYAGQGTTLAGFDAGDLDDALPPRRRPRG